MKISSLNQQTKSTNKYLIVKTIYLLQFKLYFMNTDNQYVLECFKAFKKVSKKVSKSI
jgi:hypothetical protein